MRVSLVLCAGLLLLVSAWGQEPSANTLSAKDAAEGWLLLFDGESSFGWELDGDATVAKGSGEFALRGGVGGCKIKTTSQFGDGVLQFDYLGEGLKKARCRLGDNGVVLAQGGNDKSDNWLQCKITIKDRKATAEFGSPSGKVTPVTIPLLEPLPNRPVPVVFDITAGSTVRLRNVKLLPGGLQSIFNGKSLAGWREAPGKKSKFAVTPDGWLNVKDGPGDLQTVQQWGNFILQLDCISNGKHLNSGIFFRCIPNQYQQGYEAQVRNEFTAQASQDYVLEVYDPESNKLAKKEKVKSPAIDYGTGAIYRRVPARKQMSRDGEWFTMTVLANGRHIATWVNGYPMVDWTDHRAKADNGRNGFRADPGPISIQGHDPTTDLSFRNIRIGELPAKK